MININKFRLGKKLQNMMSLRKHTQMLDNTASVSDV